MKHVDAKVTKNYSVIIPGGEPIVIRQTTTFTHAVKHAAYASELRIRVVVRDNRTKVEVLELAPIDKAHAIKAACKRDKRYAKAAKTARKNS